MQVVYDLPGLVYNSFTAGVDMVDVSNTKGLLGALSDVQL